MVKKVDKAQAWTARPRWRITKADRIALGPGKADLLEAIERTHGISPAAAELGMSYRRAWLLVAEMNASFAEPVVQTPRWRGQGASLTTAGRRVLRLYRQIERRSLSAVRSPLGQLEAMLQRGPRSPGR